MADLIDYGVTNADQSYSFSNIDHFNVSSLVTRLTSDITNIQNAVATGMRPFGRSPVMLIFATSLAFRINSTLAMVFLVALPILATLLIIIIIKVGPLYGKMQGAIDQVNRCIQENLTAIRVVKAYVRGEYEVEKFQNVNDNLICHCPQTLYGQKPQCNHGIGKG